MTATSMSPSPATDAPPNDWPALPIETDIYILPDGRIVIADLPAELTHLLPKLGPVLPCEISTHDISDSAA